jgi:hypothetical protein
VATAEPQPRLIDTGRREALAARLANLPHIVMIDRRAEAPPWDVDAFLQRPATRSIRRRTESILLCRLSADGMLVAGLDVATRAAIVARGCGEAVPGGVLMRIPDDDKEFDACWAIVEQAHQSLSAGNGTAGFYRAPMLPNFSRTRLQ